MVLMKLLAGQQWRHREQTDVDTGSGGRKERVGCVDRVTQKHIYYCM